MIAIEFTEEEVERLAARANAQLHHLKAMLAEDPCTPLRVAVRSWTNILEKLKVARKKAI